MAQPADAVNRDDVSSASAGVPQCVVDRHPRAHEWSSFFSRNFIRDRRERTCRCDHVLRISTVEVNASHFAIDAHGEIAATTLLAHEIMKAVPTDTNSLPDGPRRDVVAERVDASSDLMTRHTRILKSRPDSVFDEHVAVTDTTRLNFHAHLCGARFGNVALDQFPVSTCTAYLRCFHLFPLIIDRVV